MSETIHRNLTAEDIDILLLLATGLASLDDLFQSKSDWEARLHRVRSSADKIIEESGIVITPSTTETH